jgi:hypothetical protein
VGAERAVLCLMLTLLCGAAAAQEIPQIDSGRSKGGKTAIGAGPSAKDMFGSVTAPAPLAARAALIREAASLVA